MSNDTEEIVNLTKDMVEFQSTKDNKEAIRKNIEYIKNYFGSKEFDITTHSYEDMPSLVITFADNPDDPSLMVHGHIDVVEAKKELFKVREEDEKIYGRGTGDMKAGVACLMKAMENMKEDKPDIGLMIVSDEEIGGFKGAKKLFEEHYNPDFAISAEPNNLDGYMDIITNQKGILQLKIETEGKTAHGSRPWKGENAAEKLWEKYQEEIKPLFKDTDNGNKWETTCNLGKFNSGESTNKVPGKAEAYLDIRTTSSYPNREVIKDIENISGISVEVILDEPMLNTSRKNNHVNELQKTAKEIFKNCKLGRKEPGSDMRHLTRQNIPAVVFGPEGYNSHGPKEHSVTRSFEDYAMTIEKFAKTSFD